MPTYLQRCTIDIINNSETLICFCFQCFYIVKLTFCYAVCVFNVRMIDDKHVSRSGRKKRMEGLPPRKESNHI